MELFKSGSKLNKLLVITLVFSIIAFSISLLWFIIMILKYKLFNKKSLVKNTNEE